MSYVIPLVKIWVRITTNLNIYLSLVSMLWTKKLDLYGQRIDEIGVHMADTHIDVLR